MNFQLQKNLRKKKSNESTEKNSQERFELLLQQAENFATLLNDDSENKENGKKTRSQTIITKSPGYLGLPLKDFQIDGLNWLIRINENGLNAILADEMGLGECFWVLQKCTGICGDFWDLKFSTTYKKFL